ncbi:MAG: peptidoglycan editing factor PgeF [Nitrospirae bacterium]|nr:peptidoglycan editing factor PgeF [Nitrospirota bacterium]
MASEVTVSLQFIEEEGHRALELPAPGQRAEVRHLFGLRGPRPVKILAKLFGVRETAILSVRQVHGDSIRVIGTSGDEDDSDGAWDALVTNRKGIVITVKAADCLPILIWDGNKKVAAAVHAGWRGSLKAIASKTVLTMRSSFGCRPDDLWVGIGPAIGPCCYEVDGPVLGPLRAEFEYWKDVVRETGGGKGMLDLAGLNLRQLIASGVLPDRIAVTGACTFCHPERFYSYRRDGQSSGGMINGMMICNDD